MTWRMVLRALHPERVRQAEQAEQAEPIDAAVAACPPATSRIPAVTTTRLANALLPLRQTPGSPRLAHVPGCRTER